MFEFFIYLNRNFVRNLGSFLTESKIDNIVKYLLK